MKAIVAIEHAILTAAWHLLADGEYYADPSADYFAKRQQAGTRARAVQQLEEPGYTVTLEPLTQAG